MGSPETEAERQPRRQDETQHQVTISHGIWMGKNGMANFFGGEEYDSSVGTSVNPTPIYIGRTIEVGSYEPNAWGFYQPVAQSAVALNPRDQLPRAFIPPIQSPHRWESRNGTSCLASESSNRMGSEG
jgi:hypothetical protein